MSEALKKINARRMAAMIRKNLGSFLNSTHDAYTVQEISDFIEKTIPKRFGKAEVKVDSIEENKLNAKISVKPLLPAEYIQMTITLDERSSLISKISDPDFDIDDLNDEEITLLDIIIREEFDGQAT